MKNLQIWKIVGFLVLFVIFSSWAVAQTVVIAPTPKPKPKPNPTHKPTAPIPETPKIAPAGQVGPTTLPPTWIQNKRVENNDDFPFEKSIEVDGEVNIDLCVSEGTIRINGWNRNEIRVFVNGGSKAGFKVLNKNSEGMPTRLTILGYDPNKDKGTHLEKCLFGDEIELDVPTGTRINKLKGGETKITIKSVAKAIVENTSGDISLSDIEEGIKAKTYDGDILVENSGGTIDLDNSDGSIIAFNVEPAEIGEALKAKTNSGSVILQAVGHSVVEARSLSGLIRFTGEIMSDGQYSFNNTSGQIFLSIPEDSSCLFEVVAEKNKFHYSDFKFTRLDVSKASPTLQKTIGQIGEGEAQVVLVSQSGVVRIRKKN